MLPSQRDDVVVEVNRILDVDEEDFLEAITAFAVEQDLELDRRHFDDLVFRRKDEATPGLSGHLLGRGDVLRVNVKPEAGGYDVRFLADLAGSLGRKAAERRGHVVRSTGFAALFAFLGVRGLTNIVTVFDFMLLGTGALFGRRAMRYARKADDDFDEVERKIVNALNRVCDDALYGREGG